MAGRGTRTGSSLHDGQGVSPQQIEPAGTATGSSLDGQLPPRRPAPRRRPGRQPRTGSSPRLRPGRQPAADRARTARNGHRQLPPRRPAPRLRPGRQLLRIEHAGTATASSLDDAGSSTAGQGASPAERHNDRAPDRARQDRAPAAPSTTPDRARPARAPAPPSATMTGRPTAPVRTAHRQLPRRRRIEHGRPGRQPRRAPQ